MKLLTLAALASFTLIGGTFTGAALAGSAGAGPAGTASSTVGSIVSSGSQSTAETLSRSPGVSGAVLLDAAQNASLAAYLKAQPGTTTSGNLIIAPTTFADGTQGTITLDTATGELTLTRT